MKQLVLYCKSYRTDLKRVVRLAGSILEYNSEKIPFYVSVPLAELPLFHQHLKNLDVILLSDESILNASPRIDSSQVRNMAGSMSQQVIKSEFWRLGLSKAYLCLDSDAIFIRPFSQADFITQAGIPYTMIDEAHELIDDALRQKKTRVVNSFCSEALLVQQLFNRSGRRYSFGPFPVVWHRAVWESLDTLYLKPKGLSFADAIQQAPVESRWYGEALLAYKAIPLMPCQALFKVYHYAWQWDKDQRTGIDLNILANHYCGVIYQSAWEREMDWPVEGGTRASRFGRRLRRLLGRI